MIKIIRVGRERLREAYEIVNKVDQGMNVPEWFVAEPYEEFDFWMKKERGLLYLAVDEEGLCQKATTGQYILAMALTPATAKRDIVNVAIIHAGYEA